MRRTVLLLAGMLLLGLIGVWFWSGQRKPHSPNAGAPEARRNPIIRQRPPAESLAPPGKAAIPESNQPAAPVRITSSVVPGAPMAASSPATHPPAAATPPEASSLAPPRPVSQPEARADLENLRLMFRDYRTRLGENPVGSNAEIMKAVMGDNPAKARLGPPEGLSLNDQGELVDRWGTPFFFHQLSKTQMEIRSAGPDRIMWTSDDVVQR